MIKDKRRRSRVDKIYIDEEEADKITKNIYIKTSFDDHKILEVHYEENRKRGKGTWKLNTSLVEDIHYCQRIRLAIERAKQKLDNETNHEKKWDTSIFTC